jgi:hypothetical protein
MSAGNHDIADFVERILLRKNVLHDLAESVKNEEANMIAIWRVTLQAIFLVVTSAVKHIKHVNVSTSTPPWDREVIDALDHTAKRVLDLGAQIKVLQRDYHQRGFLFMKVTATEALGWSFRFAHELLNHRRPTVDKKLGAILDNKLKGLFRAIQGQLGNRSHHNTKNKNNGHASTVTVASVLKEWKHDKRMECWHVLGGIFEKKGPWERIDTPMVKTPIDWLQQLIYKMRPYSASFDDPDIAALYSVINLASMALSNSALWKHIVKTYASVMTQDFMHTCDKFDARENDHLETWSMQVPRADDARFSWVRSAPRRLLLQRFADRCRYQASGTDEGKDVNVFTFQEFETIKDLTHLDHYVKLSSGHCYDVDQFQKHMAYNAIRGTRPKEPMTNQVLSDADLNLIRAFGRDNSWTLFRTALVFLKKDHDLKRLWKPFCKDLMNKTHNREEGNRDEVMFVHTMNLIDFGKGHKDCGYTQITVGTSKKLVKDLFAGIGTNHNNNSSTKNVDTDNQYAIFRLPRNFAGKRLLSMFLAIASMVSTPGQARTLLSILKKALDHESDTAGISTMMITIYSMYSMLHGPKNVEQIW